MVGNTTTYVRYVCNDLSQFFISCFRVFFKDRFKRLHVLSQRSYLNLCNEREKQLHKVYGCFFFFCGLNKAFRLAEKQNDPLVVFFRLFFHSNTYTIFNIVMIIPITARDAAGFGATTGPLTSEH